MFSTMRNSPVAGAPPIQPMIRPRPQAARPFTRLRPDRTPTIDRPKITSMNNSAELNERINGRETNTKPVRMTAPIRPPISEEKKAAESPLAACPCFARGKPSSTVAWLADEPGIPIKTEAKVSDVGITATSPINIARAVVDSIPYKNGINNDKPAIPPRPGRMPTIRPVITPSNIYKKC